MRIKINEKGITLIALIITILVLIILAGVTLNVLTGDNGIINRAQQAKENTEEGQAYEEVQIAVDSLYLETNINSMTQEEKRAFLEDKLKKTDKNAVVTIDGANLSADYKNDNYKISKDREIFNAKQWDKTATDQKYFIFETTDTEAHIVGLTEDGKSLTEIRIPSSYDDLPITSIAKLGGNSDHSGTVYSPLTKVEIPETVTIIKDYTFPFCTDLNEIIIPNSVTQIGYYAFCNCTSLRNIVLSEEVKNIGFGAFSSCENLTNIVLPESLENLGWRAFYDCKSLTNIVLPENLTYISNDLFENCTQLNSITFSNSIQSIYSSAFNNCENLKTIFYKGTESEFNSIIIYENNECLINATKVYDKK
ncbi:MAG: leucine-rich repeat domain-containing protein [Clostridia bacterium]|nr:leucine-rich repeat domain-containing protein [Clostridia bacterium]